MTHKKVCLMLVLGLALVGYGSWRSPKSGTSLTQKKPAVSKVPYLTPEKLQTLPPVKQSAIASLEMQISDLTERQRDIDHELERAGFPQVFMESGIGESERTLLLAKVQESTNLGIQIAKLKFKEIDLTAGENL